MPQFIPVTLNDFEKQFNVPSKKDLTKRAFELVQPKGFEAYYNCTLKENNTGSLTLKVYTSIAADREAARDVGEDAIRIVILWVDKAGWCKAIGEKPKRVYRSGGTNSTAKDVIERAFTRAKEVAKEAMTVEMCCKCGRPMVERKGKNGFFLGCIGFVKQVCSNTKAMNVK